MVWKNVVLLYSKVPGTEETKVISSGFPCSFPATSYCQSTGKLPPIPQEFPGALPQPLSQLLAVVPA